MAALLAAAALATPAHALVCDGSPVYIPTETRASRTGLRVGVAEQFASFSTLKRGDQEVDNPAGERLRSSITQVILGYNFHPRVGLQLNLPIISRTFRRREAAGLKRDDETGFGDLALLGSLVAFQRVTEPSHFQLTLLGGLKLPSGDSRRLREELHHMADTEGEGGGGHPHPHGESTDHGGEDGHPHGGGGGEEPHGESGIHGHDLALGSGSVDGVVGGQLFWSWRRLFLTASGQYVVPTEGDFDYEYANDLTWSGGPGAFVLLGPRYSLGVQGLVSGETKGKDTLGGVRVDDTALTQLYVGPGLTLAWGSGLSAEVAADLPVVQHNTGLRIVPDYRLRGAISWRF